MGGSGIRNLTPSSRSLSHGNVSSHRCDRPRHSCVACHSSHPSQPLLFTCCSPRPPALAVQRRVGRCGGQGVSRREGHQAPHSPCLNHRNHRSAPHCRRDKTHAAGSRRTSAGDCAHQGCASASASACNPSTRAPRVELGAAAVVGGEATAVVFVSVALDSPMGGGGEAVASGGEAVVLGVAGDALLGCAVVAW